MLYLSFSLSLFSFYISLLLLLLSLSVRVAGVRPDSYEYAYAVFLPSFFLSFPSLGMSECVCAYVKGTRANARFFLLPPAAFARLGIE